MAAQPPALVQAALTADDACPASGPAKAEWERRRAVERVKRNKLDWVESEVLKSRRSKDGLTIDEYLYTALGENKTKGKRKNLDSEFWVSFYEEFGLKSPGFRSLKTLTPEELDLPDSYWEAMALVNHDNPVKRDVGPWCDFVRNMDSVSENNLIGLLHAASVSTMVSAEKSRTMLMEVARLCARVKAPKEYPSVWEAIQETIESIVVSEWKVVKTSRRNIVDREVWLESNEEVVSLFCDVQAAARVEKDVSSKVEPSVDDLKVLMTSTLGQALFHAEILNGRVAYFEATVVARISDLEHNDWPTPDIEAFRSAATGEIQDLVASGIPMYNSQELEVPFLNDVIKYTVTSLAQRPHVHLQARARSLAVSGNLVERLPWERVLFGDGGVPCIPEHSKVPDSLLVSCRRGRKVLARIVGNLGTGNTWDAMMAELTKPGNAKAVINVDREAGLEIAFALQCVTRIAATELENNALQMLPNPDDLATVPAMENVMRDLRKLRTDVKFAVATSTASDVDAIVNLLQRMISGLDVSHDTSSRSSDFYQKCRGRMSLWCSCPTKQPGWRKTEKGPGLGMLYGKEAAEMIFKTLSEQKKKKDEELICKLRVFKWLMTSAMLETLEGWTRDLVREKNERRQRAHAS